MRKILPLLVAFAICGSLLPLQAQRYLSEVFTGVTTTPNVEYAQNITVITGAPGMDTLYVDIYEPAGDTMAERPLVLIAHTGSFLPVPLNGQATGTRLDSAVVEMCMQFAKRGYVVGAYSYRLGWNPAGNQEQRTGTLLNAAYRGIQDTRTLVRFMRSTYANGNNYGIDTSRIIVGGLGTGAYMGMGVATLDDYAEINLPKFIDPNTQASYVDTSLSGDFDGLWARPLNVPNHTGYSSDIHMAFSCGGAMGDSTWLEAGDIPMVGFHVPSDPFAPYKFGAVIVPTTQSFVVNVSGNHDIIRQANAYGNNASFQSGTFNDAYTTEADMRNDGHDGLFPFFRPSPESAPWEWWDSTYWNQVPHPNGGTFHTVGLMTNPDMSPAKGRAYIDTVQNYLAPRVVCALNLPGCALTGLMETLEPGAVTVFPNPSANFLNINSDISGNLIERVELVDGQGRLVKSVATNTYSYTLDHSNFARGLYFLNVRTKQGMVTKKVILE